MKKYLLGFLKYLFYRKVSKLSFVTNDSMISHKATVNRFTKIYRSSLGDYSYVGSGSAIIGAEIGRYCSIAKDVTIGLASHTLSNISTSPIFTEKSNGTRCCWVESNLYQSLFHPVRIGNDVWIGAKVLIKDGITIGDGVIIGAGAVVTKNVPSYAIVGGVPARVIRYRYSDEIIDQLMNLKWWEMEVTLLQSNISLFQHPLLQQDLDVLKNIKESSNIKNKRNKF